MGKTRISTSRNTVRWHLRYSPREVAEEMPDVSISIGIMIDRTHEPRIKLIYSSSLAKTTSLAIYKVIGIYYIYILGKNVNSDFK